MLGGPTTWPVNAATAETAVSAQLKWCILAVTFAAVSGDTSRQTDPAQTAGVIEMGDNRIEFLLRGIGPFAMDARVGLVVLAPTLQPRRCIWRPIAGQIGGRYVDETCRPQIVDIIVNAA